MDRHLPSASGSRGEIEIENVEKLFTDMLDTAAAFVPNFDRRNELSAVMSVLVNEPAVMTADNWLRKNKERSERYRRRPMRLPQPEGSQSSAGGVDYSNSDLRRLGKNPKLFRGDHPTLKGASIALGMEFNQELGRHLIALEDIPRNSVLFSEKAFSVVKVPFLEHNSNCDYCWKIIGSISYRCNICNNARYCTELCLNNDLSSVHRYECMGSVMGLWEGVGSGYLAVRTLLKGAFENENLIFGLDVTECQQPYANVETLINKINSSTTGEYIDAYMLKPAMHMATTDLRLYSIASVTMMIYLKSYGNFFSDFLFKKFPHVAHGVMEQLVCYMLLKHILQIIANSTLVTRSIGNRDTVDIGCALYTASSMMNHSCVPNTRNRITNEGKFVAVASTDIPKNTEVTNCYNVQASILPSWVRQNILFQQYGFMCQCPACKEQT